MVSRCAQQGLCSSGLKDPGPGTFHDHTFSSGIPFKSIWRTCKIEMAAVRTCGCVKTQPDHVPPPLLGHAMTVQLGAPGMMAVLAPDAATRSEHTCCLCPGPVHTSSHPFWGLPEAPAAGPELHNTRRAQHSCVSMCKTRASFNRRLWHQTLKSL